MLHLRTTDFLPLAIANDSIRRPRYGYEKFIDRVSILRWILLSVGVWLGARHHHREDVFRFVRATCFFVPAWSFPTAQGHFRAKLATPASLQSTPFFNRYFNFTFYTPHTTTLNRYFWYSARVLYQYILAFCCFETRKQGILVGAWFDSSSNMFALVCIPPRGWASRLSARLVRKKWRIDLRFDEHFESAYQKAPLG